MLTYSHAGPSADAGAPPGIRPPRRPLYARNLHWISRVVHVAMLIFVLFGVACAVSTFSLSELRWRDVLVIPFVLFAPTILMTNLRTSALYGSVEGLEIARWGARRMVPWAKVERAEYTWWSLNYAARIAYLTIHEDKERRVLFFANDRILAELEAMRAGNGGR